MPIHRRSLNYRIALFLKLLYADVHEPVALNAIFIKRLQSWTHYFSAIMFYTPTLIDPLIYNIWHIMSFLKFIIRLCLWTNYRISYLTIQCTAEFTNKIPFTLFFNLLYADVHESITIYTFFTIKYTPTFMKPLSYMCFFLHYIRWTALIDLDSFKVG